MACVATQLIFRAHAGAREPAVRRKVPRLRPSRRGRRGPCLISRGVESTVRLAYSAMAVMPRSSGSNWFRATSGRLAGDTPSRRRHYRDGTSTPDGISKSTVASVMAWRPRNIAGHHVPYAGGLRATAVARRAAVNSGPWPRLRQTMAAVGHHHRPGDERGRLVGEKEHARGDLRRRATAPDRSRRRGGGFER